MTAAVAPVEAEVVATRSDGGFQHLSLTVPHLGDRVPGLRPGQFLVVPPEPGGAVALPRTWWLAGAHGGAGYPATLEVVVAPLDLQPQDRITVTGPLGRGFAPPTEPVPVLLVAHELAQGPIRWLAAVLAARGATAHLVLSARDPDHHLDLVAARRTAGSIVLTDPSGVPGTVATLLVRHGVAALYAAGPLDLVVAACAEARRVGVASQGTAFDAGTGDWCGVGLCGACAVPVGSPGATRDIRPCAVGPVLRGELLSAAVGRRGAVAAGAS